MGNPKPIHRLTEEEAKEILKYYEEQVPMIKTLRRRAMKRVRRELALRNAANLVVKLEKQVREAIDILAGNNGMSLLEALCKDLKELGVMTTDAINRVQATRDARH